MSGKNPKPQVEIGPTRIAPAAPSGEAARVSAAVREGLATAAAAPGPSLTVASLKVKVPRGAKQAEITRAVHEALTQAGAGRRR